MEPVAGPGLAGEQHGAGSGQDGARDGDGGRRARPFSRAGLSQYAPGEERPLGGYVVLAGIYGGATVAAAAALRRAGRELPERPHAGDIALVAVATHKLSRIAAKDKVTSFLRAPFTRYEGPGGQGEVEEEPRGHGLQLAVGELMVCPYCLSQWFVTGLTLGLVAAPRATRLACSAFAAYTVSDFLQVAYRAAEEQA